MVQFGLPLLIASTTLASCVVYENVDGAGAGSLEAVRAQPIYLQSTSYIAPIADNGSDVSEKGETI